MIELLSLWGVPVGIACGFVFGLFYSASMMRDTRNKAVQAAFDRVWNDAAAAEREACAKLAECFSLTREELAFADYWSIMRPVIKVRNDIAASIRARGDTSEGGAT